MRPSARVSTEIIKSPPREKKKERENRHAPGFFCAQPDPRSGNSAWISLGMRSDTFFIQYPFSIAAVPDYLGNLAYWATADDSRAPSHITDTAIICQSRLC